MAKQVQGKIVIEIRILLTTYSFHDPRRYMCEKYPMEPKMTKETDQATRDNDVTNATTTKSNTSLSWYQFPLWQNRVLPWPLSAWIRGPTNFGGIYCVRNDDLPFSWNFGGEYLWNNEKSKIQKKKNPGSTKNKKIFRIFCFNHRHTQQHDHERQKIWGVNGTHKPKKPLVVVSFN